MDSSNYNWSIKGNTKFVDKGTYCIEVEVSDQKEVISYQYLIDVTNKAPWSVIDESLVS